MTKNFSSFEPSTPVGGVEIAVWQYDTSVAVSLAGVLDRRSSGRVFDLMAALAGGAHQTIWVHVEGLTEVTRAGMRGLIVAAAMQKSAGRGFCIVGARPEIAAALSATGFRYLLTLSGRSGAPDPQD
ncbi:MAG: hypothetical protein AAGH83_06665 [Pseudomonadota bacterium]